MAPAPEIPEPADLGHPGSLRRTGFLSFQAKRLSYPLERSMTYGARSLRPGKADTDSFMAGAKMRPWFLEPVMHYFRSCPQGSVGKSALQRRIAALLCLHKEPP